MSRRGVVLSGSSLATPSTASFVALPPHTLPRPPLPTDHLQSVQKRLLQLLRAVSEVEAQVGGPEKLDDWPTLLSRHLNLVSQIYTLSNSLVSSTPHHVPSQLAELDRYLSQEAKGPSNLYAPPSNSSDQHQGLGQASGAAGLVSNASDALFGGRSNGEGARGEPSTSSSSGEEEKLLLTPRGVPLPTFADVLHSTLPHLSAHPYTPLDADRANTISGILRSRVDPEVEESQESLLSLWRSQMARQDLEAYGAGKEGREASRRELEQEAERRGLQVEEWSKRRELMRLREEGRKWDDKVAMALRSWYHAKEAPDEEGMRYDWKMRDVGEEEEGEGDGTKEDQEGRKIEGGGGAMRKRKRDEARLGLAGEGEQEEEEWSVEEIKAFLKRG